MTILNYFLKRMWVWFALSLIVFLSVPAAHAAMNVTTKTPKANALNVSLDSVIVVNFDTIINQSTVNDSTSFTVNGSMSGMKKGAFTFSGASVTFIPDNPFFEGEVVTVTLTKGIQSTSGSTLDKPLTWQFFVAETGGIAYFMDSGQNLGNFFSSSVALGDIDNDGDLDAFVTNSKLGEMNNLWLNNGKGNFGINPSQSMESSASQYVALGDLNKDGYLDAFVANFNGPNQIWLNDGNGKFAKGQSLGSLFNRHIALGDLDGDGDLDAFIITGMTNIEVWLNNNGTGEFDQGQILLTSYSLYTALGDLDGDGDLDAFVANGGQSSSGGPNKVWLNDGMGNFVDSNQALKNAESKGVALGDLDGDGELDAFVVNAGEANRVWKNNGKGRFELFQPIEYSDEYPASYSVSLGDLDGDKDLDAFIARAKTKGETTIPSNQIWLNNGTGSFKKYPNLDDSDESWGVALGDLDGDGDLDAFVANNGQSNKVWLMSKINPGDIDGNGDIELKDAILILQILTNTPGYKKIYRNDVNGDHQIGIEEVSFILQFISNLR